MGQSVIPRVLLADCFTYKKLRCCSIYFYSQSVPGMEALVAAKCLRTVSIRRAHTHWPKVCGSCVLLEILHCVLIALHRYQVCQWHRMIVWLLIDLTEKLGMSTSESVLMWLTSLVDGLRLKTAIVLLCLTMLEFLHKQQIMSTEACWNFAHAGTNE